MIRPYKEEDILKIIELERKYLLSSLEENYYRNDLNNPLAYHYVLEEQEGIIGFVSSIFDGSSLEILNIVIDEDKQLKGYGTQLLVTLFDHLLPFGLEKVTLEVRQSNLSAIHLYEKLGFSTICIRKEYYKNKENALVMQKLFDHTLDIIHLEANLFSKKSGIKYTSDFKERYCLNYYDLFNYKINSLVEFEWEDYIFFVSNWIDEDLFQGFDISKIALLHTNAYHYQSLSKKSYDVLENDVDGYIDYMVQSNLQYGKEYAEKYAKFSFKNIQTGKSKFFSVRIKDRIVGSAMVLEHIHSIFILGLEVEEAYRKQGIGSAILDKCISYAKQVGKLEVYLEADVEDTPIGMYKRMNFSNIQIYYEMLEVK
ncbi:MAG: ribosomal protein S18-alanine N-acetyltransferase [Anaeroplasmataceae bacterium]|nr:ribosomal protein S18-alanine N-acetyltransferase [Anaeroplasmataceae bacterium]